MMCFLKHVQEHCDTKFGGLILVTSQSQKNKRERETDESKQDKDINIKGEIVIQKRQKERLRRSIDFSQAVSPKGMCKPLLEENLMTQYHMNGSEGNKRIWLILTNWIVGLHHFPKFEILKKLTNPRLQDTKEIAIFRQQYLLWKN